MKYFHIMWIRTVAGTKGKNRVNLIAGLASVMVVILLGLSLFLCIRKRNEIENQGKRNVHKE